MENLIAAPSRRYSLAKQILFRTPLMYTDQAYEVAIGSGLEAATICFPHQDPYAGRIVYFDDKPRMLEWGDRGWIAHSYEGVTWYEQQLGQSETHVLAQVLAPQLCYLYGSRPVSGRYATSTIRGFSAEIIRFSVSQSTPLLSDFVYDASLALSSPSAAIQIATGSTFVTSITYDEGDSMLVWRGSSWYDYAVSGDQIIERKISRTGIMVLNKVLIPQIQALFQLEA